jgi:acyl carrier protein
MSELITLASGEHCTEPELRSSVRTIVLELAPSAEDAPDEGEVHLTDHLAYNSLALLELAFTLEDEYDLMPIDEETARAIVTLQDVQDYIVGELQQRATRASAGLGS